MGYTHYYSYEKPRRPIGLQKWKPFVADVVKILEHKKVKKLVCMELDTPKLPPLISLEKVQFNGKGDNGHETFLLTRAYHGEFCKTARKPYDIAVAATLISARKWLGEDVGSDGDWGMDTWPAARSLHAELFGGEPDCPWPEKECLRCAESYKRDGHSWGGSEVCANCGGGSFTGSQVNGDWVMRCTRCNSFTKTHEAPVGYCYFCSQDYVREKAGIVVVPEPVIEVIDPVLLLTQVGKRKIMEV
jgi:hypothetical protein